MNKVDNIIYRLLDDKNQNIYLNKMDKYIDDGVKVDNAIIKAKTFAKLGIEYIDSKKKQWIRKVVYISIALFILSGSIFPTEFFAAAKGIYQYIAGTNRVIESQEGNTYVLPTPKFIETDSGVIEVLSILFDESQNIISVTMRGNGSRYNEEEIYIELSNGDIKSIPSRGWASGGSWIVFYEDNNEDYAKIIREYKENEIIYLVLADNLRVPLMLTKAEFIDDIDELGISYIVNDIEIIARASIFDDVLKINFITNDEEKRKVVYYGLNPDFYFSSGDYKYQGYMNEKITLIDNSGNNIITNKDNIGNIQKGYYEFYFDISNTEDSDFVLNVPYIKVNYMFNDKVEIDVPAMGERIEYDNKVIEVEGYVAKILYVEHNEDNMLEIGVDTDFDINKQEGVYNLGIGFEERNPFNIGAPTYSGYSSESTLINGNEIGAIEKIFIEADEVGKKSFNLYIDYLEVVKKGPWVFDIHVDR